MCNKCYYNTMYVFSWGVMYLSVELINVKTFYQCPSLQTINVVVHTSVYTSLLMRST